MKYKKLKLICHIGKVAHFIYLTELNISESLYVSIMNKNSTCTKRCCDVARKCLFASIAVYSVCGINHCGIHYVEKPTVNLLAWISLLAPSILCPKLPANVV